MLLLACATPHEDGQLYERVVAGNRAILLILYDTGIRAEELIHLRMEDFDRRLGLITVKGKRSKQRSIALGQNCLRHLLSYLDIRRSDETEIAEMSNLREDHLFLTEIGQPMTTSDITLLLAMLKKRTSIAGKCLHSSTLRDTFAVHYLELSHDISSLQKLLGEEDITMIKGYVQMSQASIRSIAFKDSVDDIVPMLAESSVMRRRSFRVKESKKENA